MNQVLDKLDDWEIVQLAAQGPIVGSGPRKRVNETRRDFLVDRTRHWGPGHAYVFAAFMFENMTDDDVRTVLGLLAADQHLHDTVDLMPSILKLLADRGIDRGAFRDRGGKAIDVLTGLGNLADSVFGSSPAAKDAEGFRAAGEANDLPEPFRAAAQAQETAEFLQALSPGNVAFGALDSATLGLLSGVKGVVYDTPRAAVSGVRELGQGHVAGGVE